MNLDVRHSCNKGAYSYVQKLGEKMDQTFEKRKKIIYEFICDDMYVPMKLKELALLLNIPKEQVRKITEEYLVKIGQGERDFRF